MATRRTDKLREIEQLAGRAVDGLLSEADQERLNALLQADPEGCERYLNVLTLHAHLVGDTQAATPETPIPFPLPPLPNHPAARRSWRLPTWLSAAAAVAMLGLVLAAALIIRQHRAEVNGRTGEVVTPTVPTVATLVSADELRWETGGAKIGERIAAGRLALASGTAVFHFDSGATLTLRGPAEAHVRSDKLVELASGQATARCPEEAVGFTLRTAVSDFIDLGTEFGVAVNPDGSADVHVFEGVVIARPKASGLVVPVMHDEAGRVEAERGDLVSIDTDPGRFPNVATRTIEASAQQNTAKPVEPIPADSRIVFLGDRATDRETHLLLINQALKRLHGEVRPGLYNSAIRVMLAFREKDFVDAVLAYKPTHAVLEFGPEIAAAASSRDAGRFRADLVRLLDRLTEAGVEPILVTGYPLGDAQRQPRLDEYNVVIRDLAAERSIRLADVDRRFRALEPAGIQLVTDRGAVPTFAGYREMAAELLAVLGHPRATVDTSVQLQMLPGVVTEWHVRGKSADDLLSDADAARLIAGDGWRKLMLPQSEDRLLDRLADSSHSITYRDRARGFATDVYFGKGTILEGVAEVPSDADRDVFVNIGATVKSVWVNGDRIFESTDWGGWHAGKYRVPARLRAGANKIVIEANGSFFVSLTDRIDWPLP